MAKAKPNPWVEMGHALLRGMGQRQGIDLPFSDPDRAAKLEAVDLDMEGARQRMAQSASSAQLQQDRFGLDQKKFAADQAYKQQVLEADQAATAAKLKGLTPTVPWLGGGGAAEQPVEGLGVDPEQILAGLAGGGYDLFDQPMMEEDIGPRPIPEILGEIEQKEYTQEGLKRKLQLGKIGEAIADPNLRPTQRMELADQFYAELERSRLGDFEVITPTMEEVVGENVFEAPNGMIAIRKPDGSIDHRDNTSKREELASAERTQAASLASSERAAEQTQRATEQQVERETAGVASKDMGARRSKAVDEFIAEQSPMELLKKGRTLALSHLKSMPQNAGVKDWPPNIVPDDVAMEFLLREFNAGQDLKERFLAQPEGATITPKDPSEAWVKMGATDTKTRDALLDKAEAKLSARIAAANEDVAPGEGAAYPTPEEINDEAIRMSPAFRQQIAEKQAANMKAVSQLGGPQAALARSLFSGQDQQEALAAAPGGMALPGPGEIDPTDPAAAGAGVGMPILIPNQFGGSPAVEQYEAEQMEATGEQTPMNNIIQPATEALFAGSEDPRSDIAAMINQQRADDMGEMSIYLMDDDRRAGAIDAHGGVMPDETPETLDEAGIEVGMDYIAPTGEIKERVPLHPPIKVPGRKGVKVAKKLTPDEERFATDLWPGVLEEMRAKDDAKIAEIKAAPKQKGRPRSRGPTKDQQVDKLNSTFDKRVEAEFLRQYHGKESDAVKKPESIFGAFAPRATQNKRRTLDAQIQEATRQALASEKARRLQTQ